MINKIHSLEVKEQLIRKFERVYTQVYDDNKQASKYIAQEIAKTIKAKNAKGETCILGLATGSSPIRVYNELVRLHKEEGLSFKNVVTFNLDEYFPMPKESIQSYVYFMNQNLFDHIDIPNENINIPDGTLEENQIYDFCQSYELKIVEFGGIDIQILGIGRTGHVGFNEPGSGIDSPTRLISLDSITMRDAAGDFGALENVPRRAVTMGVRTIMNARRVFLMAWGEKKADIIKRTIEGDISESIPATFLQKHDSVEFILDQACATSLTRMRHPWLVRECDWDERLTRKAVIWLCGYLDKPILKLTNRDYNDHSLSDLLAKSGDAYHINLEVFNYLQKSITGWPGGKPNADDSGRPEREAPHKKRVLVFSPHPDDDVFSMGGTLLRLVQQGHEVHVAYQTTGNYSVQDDYVIKYVGFLNDYLGDLLEKNVQLNSIDIIKEFLKNRKSGDPDNEYIRKVKSLIRKGEAESACRYIGIPEENINFLELPFYETGSIKKEELSDEDYKRVSDMIEDVKPHQIFAAGDLTDPHGTHRKSLDTILQSLHNLRNESWMADCRLWLYKGSFQEWDIAEVDMAVPLSPGELEMKRQAIFKHQTQKEVLFPGEGEIEIWKHAQDRNLKTAQKYDKLGMAEYEAIEVFVRYDI